MAFLTTEDLDPSLISSTANLATNQDKQDALALQLKLAGQLRGRQADHGTMAGAMYIPPNPINSALDLIDRFQGLSDSMHGKKDSDALIAQRQGGLEKFFNDYLNTKRKTVTDPTTGLMSMAPGASGEGEM